jgi:tetratricopeptide (TPR) repeat protein
MMEVASESPPDLSGLDLDFSFVEGFSRPNWDAIGEFVKKTFSRDDCPEAWSAIANQWLAQLAKDLGGASAVYHSDHFLCMSDLEPELTRALLNHAERALETIRDALREAAWRGYYGKHVLLLFSDPEDYFAYISYERTDGEHALSSGAFFNRGFVHVALPYVNTWGAQQTMAHELTHLLLHHLRMPLWLNEGLAESIEARLSRKQVDPEIVEKLAAFWTEERIQMFWAGISFHTPGEESGFSYGLAQILVTFLGEKAGFIPYIMKADWRDGGQAAALTILGCDLGDVVAGFLGPGDWRPRRKAISDLFKQENNPDKAIADYTRAIESNPNDATAYGKRGSLRRKKGDLDGALADFNRALELNQSLAGAYYGRGMVEKAHGDFDRAIADFNKVIELRPDYAGSYIGRGNAQKAKGNWDAALVDYDKAIALGPKSGAAYYARGCLRQDAHDFAAALDDFRRALDLEPTMEPARCRVWLVRARLGDTAAATRELQNYLAVRVPTKTDDWPSKIGLFLAGQLAEPEFLLAAGNADAKIESSQLCQAFYYAGSKRLLAGELPAAADCFRKSIATGVKSGFAYDSAAAESRFLANKQP